MPLKKPLDPRQGTYDRLLEKFQPVSDSIAHALLEVATEILETRNACAKAVCMLCDAGDPRVIVKDKHVHICSFLKFENTDTATIQLPCRAHQIWSLP